MFFYIIFCFLVFLPKKHLKGLFALVLGMNFIYLFIGGDALPAGTWNFYINPVIRLVDFLAGMLLCDIYKSRKEKISAKNATYLELFSLILLLIMMYLGTKNIVSIYARFDIYYLIPVSFLIYAFALNRGAISKLIGNKVFVFLGESSFAFYMIHQIVLVKSKQIIGSRINSISTMFGYGMIILLITLIIAICISYLFEKPANSVLLKLRKKMLDRRNN